jgi:integrase
MPYIRKLPSGRYQVTVKHRGQRYSKTLTTKTAARLWGLELEDRLDRGLEVDPNAGRQTLGTYGDLWWKARDVEKSTRAGDDSRWETHLKPKWQDVPLERISTAAVQAWVTELKTAPRVSPKGRPLPPLSAATVHKCVNLLSAMLASAVRERLLVANPVVYVKLPTPAAGREVFLTREQVAALDEAAGGQDGLVITVLAFCGLRWGELAGLRVRRLDMLRSQLDVVEVMTRFGPKDYPKSRKSRRTIPIPEEVKDRLAAHLAAARARRDDLVFRTARGAALSDMTFRHRAWARAIRLTGLEELQARPHDLRHTAASWLVQAGVPLYEVQHFLGHESIVTTQRYAHLAPDAHDRIREAFRAPEHAPERAHTGRSVIAQDGSRSF